MVRPAAEVRRFWSKVKEQVRGFTSPCLIWTGLIVGKYGRFSTQRPEHKSVGAHRYAYALVHGERFLFGEVQGRTHEPDHLCRQTDCVNPGHIEWVTVLVNRQRQHDANRTEMCKKGSHLRTDFEKVDSLGRKFCGGCATEADRRRRRRERGE